MRRSFSVWIVVALLLPMFAWSAKATTSMPAFVRRWARDDADVATGQVQEPWTWGPIVLRSGVEPYAQSPQGRREIWYLDKGRMEILQPSANPEDEWYVSSGLLTSEMISGKMQVGDDEYESWQPANVPVAGDLEAPTGETITYADLRPHSSISGEARANPRAADQRPITARVAPGGMVSEDQRLAAYGVRTGGYDEILGHNIATVFLDKLPAEELVYLAGRPLTEPYWARVPVGGQPKDVLLQAFERRVLTYTPSNLGGWQVEWGNVGRQYMFWRYGVVDDGRPFDPRSTLEAGIDIRPLGDLSETTVDSMRQRAGVVGVAVYVPGGGLVYGAEATRRFPMYSTTKVPIMLAVLDRAVREGRELADWEQSLITEMIQVSDNEAATQLMSSLGGAQPIEDYLIRIGIMNTHIDPTSWGTSTTTPLDMARLMDKLGACAILVPRLCEYALETLQGVIPSQRWGISAAVSPNDRVALKNGWYPEDDGWAVNSMGVVSGTHERYVIAVFTHSNPSKEYGVETIDLMATHVNHALR